MRIGIFFPSVEHAPWPTMVDRFGGVADDGYLGVAAPKRRLEHIGASDFVAIPCGTAADRARTREHLASLA
jgi:hypothetical protein